MKHVLLNLLTALSLTLCVALAGLWVCSYWFGHEVRLGTGRPYGAYSLVAAIESGRLRVGTLKETFVVQRAPEAVRRRILIWRRVDLEVQGRGRRGGPPGAGPLRRLGLDRITLVARQGTDHGELRQTFDTFGAPLWLPTAAAALPPALWLRRRRLNRRRNRRGLCLACGYDLRATPERCPECGAMPAASSASLSPGTPTGH